MGPEIRAAKHTHPGRMRDQNEDFCEFRVPAQPEELLKKGVLCMVADGMGGHEGGKAASQWATTIALERYYSDKSEDVSSSLLEAVQAANTEVREMASRNHWASVGTTLVGAVARGEELTIVNVGDSRAYLIRGKSIRQLTRDHTWVREQVDAGLMTPERAAVDSRRNAITRSLGPRPEVKVDLFREKLEPGDAVVLCSDGLTGPLYGPGPAKERDILNIVSRSRAPEEAARKLVDLANRRGASDNVSAIVLQYGRRRFVPLVSRVLRFAAIGLVALVGLGYGASSFLFASSASLPVRALPTPPEVLSESLTHSLSAPIGAVPQPEAAPSVAPTAVPESPTATATPTLSLALPTQMRVATATPLAIRTFATEDAVVASPTEIPPTVENTRQPPTVQAVKTNPPSLKGK